MLLDPFIILFLIGKYANSGSCLMLIACYIFSVFACIYAALDTKIMIVKCVLLKSISQDFVVGGEEVCGVLPQRHA